MMISKPGAYMKLMAAILGFVLMTTTAFALETPRTKSLMAVQIEYINHGIATGQITDETKDFFIQSIKEMQNLTPKNEEGAVAKFTRLVHEGIALGQISDETKGFFLNAIKELTEQ